jgi:hypothetical protein
MYIYIYIYVNVFLYIHSKLAYASQVIISLTEDGEVAGKLSTFASVGLLPSTEKLSPVIIGD